MVYWLLRGWAVFAEEMTDWLDCGSCTHINNLAGFISWGSMVKVSPWQCPSSASVPPQGAPDGSRQLNTLTQRGQPIGRPANASGARASHLQSRQSHRMWLFRWASGFVLWLTSLRRFRRYNYAVFF